MNVHLVPTQDLDEELFGRIISLLQAVPGVNKFFPAGPGTVKIPEDLLEQQEIPTKDDFEKRQILNTIKETVINNNIRTWEFPHIRSSINWKDLFSTIKDFRITHQVPESDFIILLTPVANKRNWFAALDEQMPHNGFVHTGEWEHYIDCDPAIPIAFEVLALTLQKHIFSNYEEVSLRTHERAIGCISDLCLQKTDIILKMRTADICPTCLGSIREQLSMPEIHHALNILESLRVKMLYAQNFRQCSPPSRISIRKGGRLFLTDYGNIEIRMPTMEKALYLLFLRHPGGIYLSSLADYKQELTEIYGRISTRGMQEDINRRISELTNILREQLSIKLSRIKKAFTDAIGASLADHYIIQGANAEKKGIKLDREMVEEVFII